MDGPSIDYMKLLVTHAAELLLDPNVLCEHKTVCGSASSSRLSLRLSNVKQMGKSDGNKTFPLATKLHRSHTQV